METYLSFKDGNFEIKYINEEINDNIKYCILENPVFICTKPFSFNAVKEYIINQKCKENLYCCLLEKDLFDDENINKIIRYISSVGKSYLYIFCFKGNLKLINMDDSYNPIYDLIINKVKQMKKKELKKNNDFFISEKFTYNFLTEKFKNEILNFNITKKKIFDLINIFKKIQLLKKKLDQVENEPYNKDFKVSCEKFNEKLDNLFKIFIKKLQKNTDINYFIKLNNMDNNITSSNFLSTKKKLEFNIKNIEDEFNRDNLIKLINDAFLKYKFTDSNNVCAIQGFKELYKYFELINSYDKIKFSKNGLGKDTSDLAYFLKKIDKCIDNYVNQKYIKKKKNIKTTLPNTNLPNCRSPRIRKTMISPKKPYSKLNNKRFNNMHFDYIFAIIICLFINKYDGFYHYKKSLFSFEEAKEVIITQNFNELDLILQFNFNNKRINWIKSMTNIQPESINSFQKKITQKINEGEKNKYLFEDRQCFKEIEKSGFNAKKYWDNMIYMLKAINKLKSLDKSSNKDDELDLKDKNIFLFSINKKNNIVEHSNKNTNSLNSLVVKIGRDKLK